MPRRRGPSGARRDGRGRDRRSSQAHHTTTSEHMPPAHQAMAKRTPDKLRTEAAALGLAIDTYVDRLLGAREHPEQALRACLGVLRLAGTYGKERLELAIVYLTKAGGSSSFAGALRTPRHHLRGISNPAL
jgi:hypothetical protein